MQIDTNLFCKLNSRQDITLPNSIRSKLLILPGMIVTIRLLPGTNDIKIQQDSVSTFDNKMVVSENGSIRIPSEIIKRARIRKGDRFHIFIAENDESLLLKKVNV
ncbi:AbrB/MazE/SpoVT family DNA-binding domain-containing protein [Alkalihalophilus lindianensis]|uniref:AbrB/MazE/SpoVT family DNA-binding domain-containing protein n=1 Tax=Alkalihalophilus lindianensis TaxID=1630542 RepID=A0ABU3XEW8_9BACI|nr:AbrB/MazE/SpoVT family DNA-binding domain-containing protein [Alkalihalophilus lindianensis]MDV2686438.1 AbrB/MazE/SpoVT family DNA-binding domain-containing protein [Alkalihalophilus lindianensis]